jgi:hypothetical protein
LRNSGSIRVELSALRPIVVSPEMSVMDLTPSIPSSMPAHCTVDSELSPLASPLPSGADPSGIQSAGTEPTSAEIQATIRRIVDEVGTSTGRAIRPEDLLLHLLSDPEGLGQEALQAAGAKPQRVRAEFLRLMGHADDAARLPVERVPWPLARWAWIAVSLSLIGYPLSIGPMLLVANMLDLESSAGAALEIVYFPIIWLYDSIPLVEAFYDWYLKVIGYS